jgi:Low affinity iron permease
VEALSTVAVGLGTEFSDDVFYSGEAHLCRHREFYRPSFGATDYISVGSIHHHRVGCHRTDIRLLQYLAAYYQHWNDNHHISDGLHYSKYPKSRWRGGSVNLDELIRVSAAQNALIGIEHLTEDEISEIREKCLARVKKAGSGAQKNANKKARAAINKTV